MISDGGDVIEAGGNQIRLIEVVLSVSIINLCSFYTFDMATKVPLRAGFNIQYLYVEHHCCIVYILIVKVSKSI